MRCPSCYSVAKLSSVRNIFKGNPNRRTCQQCKNQSADEELQAHHLSASLIYARISGSRISRNKKLLRSAAGWAGPQCSRLLWRLPGERMRLGFAVSLTSNFSADDNEPSQRKAPSLKFKDGASLLLEGASMLLHKGVKPHHGRHHFSTKDSLHQKNSARGDQTLGGGSYLHCVPPLTVRHATKRLSQRFVAATIPSYCAMFGNPNIARRKRPKY
jgi:hypothetical protein